MINNSEIRIALLYGGISKEHEISLISALRVYEELVTLRYNLILIFIDKDGIWYLQNTHTVDGKLPRERNSDCELIFSAGHGLRLLKDLSLLELDIALPLTHGKWGEDGILQGILETIHLPYIGPSPFSSMMGMHKKVTKLVAKDFQVPVVPSLTLSAIEIDKLLNHDTISHSLSYLVGYKNFRKETLQDVFIHITNKLGKNLVLKPEDEGSSIGIEVYTDDGNEKFFSLLEKTSQSTANVLIESLISDMVEVECGIFKDSNIIASTPRVIHNPKTENPHILSYKQKYFSNDPFSIGAKDLLTPTVTHIIKEMAILLSEVLLIEGFARVDFFYQKESGKIYFNEINTIPGLTKTSIFPLLMEESGYPLGILLSNLIHQKLENS